MKPQPLISSGTPPPSSKSAASTSISLFDSALASVSEMATKSQDFAKEFVFSISKGYKLILRLYGFFLIKNIRKVVKPSKDSLTRAFSFKLVTTNERSSLKNEPAKEENINEEEENRKQDEAQRQADWSESIGATATTALNTIINPFESASTSIVNSAQKHKHSLFSKIESHSLSISSALFGPPREFNTQTSLQDPFDESDQDLEINDMLANNTSNTDMEESLITSSLNSAGGSSIYTRFLFFLYN